MQPVRTLTGRQVGPVAVAFSVAFASQVPTSTARAQVGPAIHVELGGATMLSHHQRDVLGFRNGVTVMVRPELRLGDMFGVELNVGGLWFPSSDGPGRVFLAGAGFRLQPAIGDAGRFVVDAHANYANTEGLSRFAFDTGLAFEFRATDHVGIGPYLRYTHVVAARPSDGADATMLSYGLTLAVGPAPRQSDVDDDGFADEDDLCPHDAAGDFPDDERAGCPVRDTDGDGVADFDDVCVTDHAGGSPDPARPGCPLRDADGDGILDADDRCPSEPAGARPDPVRAGCPYVDSDSDGVFDAEDLCPSEARGASPDPRRPGCPDGDDDRDGFANSLDECRGVHANRGFHPDTDHPGCPMADRDGDTIPDVADACPDVAGAPNGTARRNGCPGLLILRSDRIVISRSVFFATGQDQILPSSRRVLAAIADVMRTTPGIRRISIEGHTDDVGTAASNRDLSERRAANVMRWMVEHGVDASRLTAHGVGETEPEAPGTSAEAREQNRQVDFLITDPVFFTVTSEGGSR